MNARSRFLFPLVGALFLAAGCSNQQESSPFVTILAQALVSIQGTGNTAPPIVPQNGFLAVSPELVAVEKNSVIGVVLGARNSQALLTPSGQSGNFTTWLSADRASFTFIGGAMLVRTSGLGNDLQNAEFNQLLAAMASGQGGTTQRVHGHLTRDFQQDRMVFTCEVTAGEPVGIRIADQSFSTLRFEEACENATESFTNVYWVDAGTGLIVQSVQWVHPNTGLAYFQIING